LMNGAAVRHVVVLAPMPLEMDAITMAFGLRPAGEDRAGAWIGVLGRSDVTAVHTGMGPALTRVALDQLFDERLPGRRPIDHVMSVGICGGLDPAIEVGTLVIPKTVIEHTTGVAYAHRPPGTFGVSGSLITMAAAVLDHDLSRRFLAEGVMAVDMESAAVAEVCQTRQVPWSVYRCIGDRWCDGLLDERVLAATNQDGSGDPAALSILLKDPVIRSNLERLGRETSKAARLAAEAAVSGCLALDD
jgi:adenosylhomocysteine nucleosidase